MRRRNGAGEFGKEALDEIEPGAVLGSESEFEAVRGLAGEPGCRLFGDLGGMIVEDQLDRRVGRIGGAPQTTPPPAGAALRAGVPAARRTGRSVKT
jgi:hypothetical protein